MFWPHAYRLPKWILSAAAVGMLAVPVVANGQMRLSPATGKPTIQPVSRTSKPTARTAAPAVPPAEEALAAAPMALAQASGSGGETEVQKELRRLYQESGREAPAVPTPEQMQSINSRNGTMPAQIAPYGSYGAAPPRGVPAPGPSAPVRSSSRNPVVSFFQRLVPGRDSKPVTQAAAPATTHPVAPPTPNPAALVRQAPPPARNYTPYNGAQPQRLPEAPTRPAAVAAAPAPAAPAPKAARPVPPKKVDVPQAPINVAEKLQLEPEIVIVPRGPVRAEIIATPAPVQPVITGPQTVKPSAPPSAIEVEPVFESPVMVDATEDVPFESPIEAELGPEAPMETARTDIANADDPEEEFPEPFSAENEAAADQEVMESPFNGVALEDDTAIAAQPVAIEAAPQTDAAADPFPLTVPSVAATTTPAPASISIAADPEAKTNAVETEIAAPAATLPAAEDDEFFPADVAKPVPEAKTSDEPVLTAPNAPIIAVPTAPAPQTIDYTAKMQKIKDRGGMKGLKGFCPVTLRDERELKDAKAEFHSQFRGQKFHFASAEAKAKFDQSPAAYAPAAYGADVVVLTRDKDVAEGTLDFAAWFKGQLYLFSSDATHAVFTDDPAKFAAPMGLE